MAHATARSSSSGIRSDDAPGSGKKLAPTVKAARTLFEELTNAGQASGGAISAVSGVDGKQSPSQPLETMFLESCDITEMDVSFDDIPVELTVPGTAMAGSLEAKTSLLSSGGGPDTVTKLPLVAGWSEPIVVPSSRPTGPTPPSACQLPHRSCKDCHHANTPLTVRQKRFRYLQTMCGSASPALPKLLSAPEPLSERCDWKIKGGTVGDWRKCPQRPRPAYEKHFSGSKFQLLEARRRELDRALRERAAKQMGIPVHMFVHNTPFFEWPTPPGMDW
ncbi:hypothetical protein GSI_09518 [Ganoderma sinense ZZ0214-1]|uniref:Uncharacterized protein n=1 Tax=Ganoderma sinense ZZ0214-1 TaxID=1077348 RepID=A0A2G8S3R2_9APHY|nr:hypothetical protein GSI_09518 [Ganoderma sinense ZZ0214-1]